MKITFKCEHFNYNDYTGEVKGTNKIVTHELLNDVSLTEVLEGFEEFLRGSGFTFDGYIDVVPHETNDWSSFEDDADTEVTRQDLPGWPFPIEEKLESDR